MNLNTGTRFAVSMFLLGILINPGLGYYTAGYYPERICITGADVVTNDNYVFYIENRENISITAKFWHFYSGKTLGTITIPAFGKTKIPQKWVHKQRHSAYHDIVILFGAWIDGRHRVQGSYGLKEDTMSINMLGYYENGTARA